MRTMQSGRIFFVQVVMIFHSLKHGWLTIDFEVVMSYLISWKCCTTFETLNQHNYWNMDELMHEVMFQSTHLIVQKAQFIYVSCDEIITINNQCWFLSTFMLWKGENVVWFFWHCNKLLKVPMLTIWQSQLWSFLFCMVIFQILTCLWSLYVLEQMMWQHSRVWKLVLQCNWRKNNFPLHCATH